MKFTIEDVAKRAGVSITTVSRVINNNYPVKESTRVKVEKAIKELEFKPNTLARGLIQKKTFTIGVIVPSLTNLFFPEVVKGIESSIRNENYTLFLCETKEDLEDERLLVERLREKQVDGIIVIGPSSENIKNGYFERITKEIPTVLVNGYNRGIRCNFVLTDEEMGTIEALEHLLELGHKNIAFIRGKQSYSYDLKEEIFYRIMSKHNIDVPENNFLKIPAGNSLQTVELARESVKSRLMSENIPTAIFCCNDWMATGAISAAKSLGINVPDRFSVIGFDNILISEISEPKLSTVDQCMYRLGDGAASLLLEIINCNDSKDTVKKVILETKLIKRSSCGVNHECLSDECKIHY